MVGFGNPFSGVAMAPDASGIYTAGYDFVVVDEEQGTGYVDGSGISSYNPKSGATGCVLFMGRNNPGCTRRPKKHGWGFFRAYGVAVTPGGNVLAGFSGAATLVKRNAKTQKLSAIRGRSACVASGKPKKTGCSRGHGLGDPVDFAFSADGRFAYAPNGSGVDAFRLKE
jgi:hypothetical protein